MTRHACICVPRFPVAALHRAEPELRGTPLVLTAAEGTTEAIANLELVGHYAWGGLEVTRPLQGGTMVRTGLPNGQGRLTQGIPFAVAGVAPVLVTATAMVSQTIVI